MFHLLLLALFFKKKKKNLDMVNSKILQIKSNGSCMLHHIHLLNFSQLDAWMQKEVMCEAFHLLSEESSWTCSHGSNSCLWCNIYFYSHYMAWLNCIVWGFSNVISTYNSQIKNPSSSLVSHLKSHFEYTKWYFMF